MEDLRLQRDRFVERLRSLSERERIAILDQECSDPRLRESIQQTLLALSTRADTAAPGGDETAERTPAGESSDALLEHTATQGDIPAAARAVADAAEALREAIAQRSDDERDPHLGRRIGSYEIKHRIGQGGFGSVYRAARRDDFKQYVAIKLIKPGYDSEAFAKRFELERKVLAALDHDNIARFIDAGETQDGHPYVIMEYVDGEPLLTYCDTRKLDVRARLNLLRQICSAVQFAHSKFVLHRDIKPSNILVTKDGVPKLVDFGIAKAMQPGIFGTIITLDHDQGGLLTPEYASPEQVRGEDLDVRSDLYSLGVVAYELLSGHKPYYLPAAMRRVREEMIRVVCDTEPRPPSDAVSQTVEVEAYDPQTGTLGTRSVTPDSVATPRSATVGSLKRALYGDLDVVILMALRKEASRRYVSVEQFASDIENYLQGLPIDAKRDSVWYVVSKRIDKYKLPLGIGASFVVLLLASSIAFYTQWTQASAATVEAEAARGVAEQAREEALSDRDRARRAEADAQRRLEQVDRLVEFQTQMLKDLDAQSFGDAISRAILDSFAQRAQLAGWDAAERAQNEARLKAGLARVNFTTVGRDALLDTVLDPAIDALADAFADSSEEQLAEARMLLTLEETLKAFGRSQQRESLALRAVELLTEVHGADHRSTLAARHRLAQARRDAARTLSAGAELDAARDVAKAEFLSLIDALAAVGPDAEAERLAAMQGLALLYREGGSYEQAERLLREVLAGWEALEVVDDYRRYRTLGNLGQVLKDQRRLVEAEEKLRAAYDGLAALDNVRQYWAMDLLGGVLFEQEKFAAALEVWEPALAGAQQRAGDNARDTIARIGKVAAALGEIGELERAERFYREAIARAESKLGPFHRLTRDNLTNLAFFLEKHDRAAEALPVLERAIEIGRATLDDSDPTAIFLLNNLAMLYQSLDRMEEATDVYELVLINARRFLEPEDDRRYVLIFNVARNRERLGRFDEARQLMWEAYEGRRATVGLLDQRAVSALFRYGLMMENTSTDPQEWARLAEQWAARVDAVRAADLPPEVLGASINTLAYTYVNQEKLAGVSGAAAKAVPLLREGVDLLAGRLGDDAWPVWSARSALGEALFLEASAADDAAGVEVARAMIIEAAERVLATEGLPPGAGQMLRLVSQRAVDVLTYLDEREPTAALSAQLEVWQARVAEHTTAGG